MLDDNPATWLVVQMPSISFEKIFNRLFDKSRLNMFCSKRSVIGAMSSVKRENYDQCDRLKVLPVKCDQIMLKTRELGVKLPPRFVVCTIQI